MDENGEGFRQGTFFIRDILGEAASSDG